MSWLLSEMSFSLRCRTGCSLVTELAAESSCGEETRPTRHLWEFRSLLLAELLRGTFREHLAVWGRRRLPACPEVLQIYAVECNHVCVYDLQHPEKRKQHRRVLRAEKKHWMNSITPLSPLMSASLTVRPGSPDDLWSLWQAATKIYPDLNDPPPIQTHLPPLDLGWLALSAARSISLEPICHSFWSWKT